MHFCENMPFLAKNAQIFDQFGDKVNFLRFSITLSMVPTVLVIFSIIDIVLVKVGLKKPKNWPILDPKFPYKSRKHANHP